MTIRRFSNITPEEVRIREQYLISKGYRFVPNATEKDLLPHEYTKMESSAFSESPYGPRRWIIIAREPD